MTVDYIYKYALSIIRKNQAGGLKSTDFCFHWNGESNAYHTDLIGHFQRMNNGKGGNNTGLIENEVILTKLSPFTKNDPALAITSGQATKPSKFSYLLALRINGEKVFHINHGQIAAVNKSVIDPASTTDDKYYFTEYENKFSFLPNTVTAVDIDYIESPTDVVWGYTFDVDSRQVDDSTTSVQPQWLDSDCLEITKRMLKTLGVAFSSQDFQNFGNSVINTGN